MTMYRCDRCGMIENRIRDIDRVEQIRQEAPGVKEIKNTWDICGKCAEELVSWMKGEQK